MENNIGQIKLFVLSVHFEESYNYVINLHTDIVYKNEADMVGIVFNKIETIDRNGNEILLKGYYTTQKLCDAMYLSFVDSDDFDLAMTEDEKKEYMSLLDRAYSEYPEILI